MKKQGVTSNTYYERNHSEKAINYKRLQSYMIPTMTFWNTQNYRQWKDEWLAMVKGKEGWISWAERAFRAVKFSVWHYNGGYIVQTHRKYNMESEA